MAALGALLACRSDLRLRKRLAHRPGGQQAKSEKRVPIARSVSFPPPFAQYPNGTIMQKLFELAFVLLFVMYCLWLVARPIWACLEILADGAAREERRRRQRIADHPHKSDAE